MALISTTIPNLIGGVSQQPSTVRFNTQGDLQENGLSSPVDGLQQRPPSLHVAAIEDGQLSSAFIHTINRDTEERYVVVVTDGELQVFDIDGDEKTVAFPDGKTYLNAATPARGFRAVTIADYTFIVNRNKTAVMDAAKKTPAFGAEAVVYIEQGFASTKYSITVDSETASKTTSNTASDYETNKIAEDLGDALGTALGADYVVTVLGNAIHVARDNAADFSISVTDSVGNTYMSLTKDKVQRFSDLTPSAPTGMLVEITGDTGSTADNYWVKFVPTNSAAQFDTSGTWQETVAPNITYQIDPDTMPHALIRETDGTFTFRTIEWGERTSGDEDSSPDPSFVGSTIRDVFFWRNRLGFLTGDNVVMSRAGEFFEFFRDTVMTLLDGDPIDVSAAHAKVSYLNHAVPYEQKLMLFSDQTQFAMEGGDMLTSRNASITAVTSFENSATASPVVAGRMVFFASSGLTHSQVREYFSMDRENAKDASNVTSHVPSYLPGEITKFTVSTNEDTLCLLTDGDESSVYVYQYYWMNEDKLQSAWHKWTFDGKVLNIDFIGGTLFLLIQRDDGVYLDKINVVSGRADEESTYLTYLDRRLDETQVSCDYDAEDNETVITLPYIPTGLVEVVDRVTGKVYNVLDIDDDEVTVAGDVSAEDFFVGVPFVFRFRFSTATLKTEGPRGGQIAVTDGRLQVRHWLVDYANTGYFRVEVTPQYRTTHKYHFNGRVLGSGNNLIGSVALESGTLRVPVQSKNDQVVIEIVNDSHLPCFFSGAGWEGFYTLRSRRV
jgi:hypothetical protein